MRVAPYSYDWIDNAGRRSPRRLTPGVDELEVGQTMMVFHVTSFERDSHITGVATPAAVKLFGDMAGTYAVRALDEITCRLVVRLDLAGQGLLGRARQESLAWGDLLMMRKQLLTFKHLAESTTPSDLSSAARQQLD
jgi:hypothetical protein